ncbi:MAG: hypothetical protein ACLP9L_32315, partial [Thermoguttaceae bacterium]
MSIVDDSRADRNAARIGDQNASGTNGTHVNSQQTAPEGVQAVRHTANGSGGGNGNQPATSTVTQPVNAMVAGVAAVVANREAAREAAEVASYDRALEAYKADHFGRVPPHNGMMMTDPEGGRVHVFGLPAAEDAAQLNPEDI